MSLIQMVFPTFGQGKEYLQLTARKAGTTVDAEFVTTEKELKNTVAAWSKMKYDVYYTLVLFGKINKAESMKRLPHTISSHRKHVVLDFDFKHQKPEFTQVKPVYDAVKSVLGTANALVKSGNGIHLYYLTNLKTPEALLNMQARALATFSNVSADATLPFADQRAAVSLRDLIRVPGSYNQKSGTQVVVKLGSPNDLMQSGKLGAVKKQLLAIPANTGINPYTKGFKGITEDSDCFIEDIYQECAVLRQFLQDSNNNFVRNGNVVGDREDVLCFGSLINFASSNKLPINQYRKKMIDRLLNFPQSTKSWIETQVDSVRFPRGCTYWSQHYKPKCKDCNYYNNHATTAIPTPIGAGRSRARKKEQQTQALANTKKVEKIFKEPIVSPGKYIAQGSTLLLTRGDGKSPVPVTEDFFIFGKGKATKGNGTIVNIYDTHGNKNIFTLKGVESQVMSEFARLGYIPNPKTTSVDPKKAMIDYYNFMCSQLISVSGIIGWSEDLKSFSLPEATYKLNSSGVVEEDIPPVLNMGNHGSYSQTEKGSADAWWNAVKTLYFKWPETGVFAKAVLCSFASVLYKFVDVENTSKGHTYNMVGIPGSGKSIALNVAASVWGKTGFTQTKANTVNFMLNSLQMVPHMPVTFDDIMRTGISMKDDDIASIVHQVTEGQTRGRVSQTGTNQDTHYFSNILISTSNESLGEMVAQQQKIMHAGAAGMERITEHDCPNTKDLLEEKYSVDVKQIANKVMIDCLANGGHAGREFIRYVMPRRDKINTIAAQLYAQETKINTDRHTAKFHCMLKLAVTIFKLMGRLTTVPNECIYGVPAGTDYVADKKISMRANFVDSVPTYAAFVKSLYGEWMMTSMVQEKMPSGRTALTLQVLPPLTIGGFQSNLNMWRIEKKLPQIVVKLLGQVKDVVIIEHNKTAINPVLARMGCIKPFNQVLKIWIESGQVKKFRTPNDTRLSFRTRQHTLHNGTLIVGSI